MNTTSDTTIPKTDGTDHNGCVVSDGQQHEVVVNNDNNNNNIDNNEVIDDHNHHQVVIDVNNLNNNNLNNNNLNNNNTNKIVAKDMTVLNKRNNEFNGSKDVDKKFSAKKKSTDIIGNNTIPGSDGSNGKVCYDNPAFIGLSVQNLATNSAALATPPTTNISIIISSNGLLDMSDSGHRSHPIIEQSIGGGGGGSDDNNHKNNHLSSASLSSSSHAYRRRERTLSVASVMSITNSLAPDRRYSRRQSIIQRKVDAAATSGGDDNPLRRKMSFIKETAGDEPLRTAFIQILIASLFAGFGNVGAGVIINIIQKWRVFIEVKVMFVLIPSLLGLKGNLEMTMASRLSTEANMGHMDSWGRTIRMIGGDMALVQCQATVVSFLAAFVAIGIDFARTQEFIWQHFLIVTATSVVTANVACFLLGLVMAFVIVFSNKINIDPDNVATPIAASLGDVSTAALFAFISEWIYADIADSGVRTIPVLAIAGIVVFLILLPVFYVIARRNSFTRRLVHSGWLPVIMAMVISSGGGFFLDSAVDRYDRLPPFQPVICGVGGNLVAVAASKISTRLHMTAILGSMPFGVHRISSPIGVFFNKLDINTKLCLLLLSMAIPLQLLYSLVIWGIQSDVITITAPLILLYVTFATAQVFVLLFVGYNLIHLLWSFAINPDMSAIPIMTALGDLLGSAFLLIAFGILESIGDPNARQQTITTNSTATDAINMTTTTVLSIIDAINGTNNYQ